MGMITGVTLGGEEYTPEFVVALDQSKCIGCGRCFKVCPRDVLDLVERDELEMDDRITLFRISGPDHDFTESVLFPFRLAHDRLASR